MRNDCGCRRVCMILWWVDEKETSKMMTPMTVLPKDDPNAEDDMAVLSSTGSGGGGQRCVRKL